MTAYKLIFIGCLLLLFLNGSAQHFQFSQYNFTAQRVNPALVASSDYASLSFDYRNQSTGGDFNLSSNMVSAAYPFLSKKNGRRWSGVGLSFLDDRSGQAGIFNTTEVSAAYAANIFLSRFQTLSLGMKGLYQKRRTNLDGLYTGSQYIPDRGFDESVSNGENLQFLNSDFFTLAVGLYWQQTDRDKNKVAYWGFSFFDFNNVQASFLPIESRLNSTFVAHAGLRIYKQGNVSIFPEFLYTRSSANNVMNLGAITSFVLKAQPKQVADRVDLITKYVIGRSGIVGFQFHRENFSVGMSYDFPIFIKNVGNLGAFEIGLEFRRLVNPRLKNQKAVVKKTPSATQPLAKNDPKQPAKKVSQKNTNRADSTQRKISPPVKKSLSASLQAKQDSVIAEAQAGRVSHEPLVLEKITLHFNFEFNSTDLDEESTKQMDDLSAALLENEHLRIKLTGHTDNVGSARFNQRLSLLRAETLKDYLIKKGIEEDRIDAEGKGLSEPLNENKTEEERAKNRRVELTILYEN